MNQLLVLGAVLWLVFAIGVASHANGRNRSSLFWFVLTAITGIFGIMIYLLFITSQSTKMPEEGIQTSTEIGYVLAGTIGAICAGLLGSAFIHNISLLTLPPVTDPGYQTSPLDPDSPLFTLFSTLIGLVIGVSEFRNKQFKEILMTLTYVPVILISLFSFGFVISLFRKPEGIFYGGYKMVFAPLVLILIAFVFSESWRRIKNRILAFETEHRETSKETKVIEDQERRKLLSGISLTVIPFLGYGIYGENPDREEEIRDNKIDVQDGCELSALSYGYSETDDEYHVSGIVNPTKEIDSAVVEVEWYIGTGVGYSSTSTVLDLGVFGGELKTYSDTFEMVVDSDTSSVFEPSEIKRFELVVRT